MVVSSVFLSVCNSVHCGTEVRVGKEGWNSYRRVREIGHFGLTFWVRRVFGTKRPGSIATGKSLSTMLTIVADFGDNHNIYALYSNWLSVFSEVYLLFSCLIFCGLARGPQELGGPGSLNRLNAGSYATVTYSPSTDSYYNKICILCTASFSVTCTKYQSS